MACGRAARPRARRPSSSRPLARWGCALSAGRCALRAGSCRPALCAGRCALRAGSCRPALSAGRCALRAGGRGLLGQRLLEATHVGRERAIQLAQIPALTLQELLHIADHVAPAPAQILLQLGQRLLDLIERSARTLQRRLRSLLRRIGRRTYALRRLLRCWHGRSLSRERHESTATPMRQHRWPRQLRRKVSGARSRTRYARARRHYGQRTAFARRRRAYSAHGSYRRRRAAGKRSRPPAGLTALIERFDPDVIDVPSGSARIRLAVDGEGEWDAVIDAGAIELQPASERQPDALLSADGATWERIARDVRGGMVAFREGRLSVRQNLHLGVGFLAATSGIADERRLRFASVHTRLGKISTLSAGEGDPSSACTGWAGPRPPSSPPSPLSPTSIEWSRWTCPASAIPTSRSAPPMTRPTSPRSIEALLDELGIERAHLIGNSMGGRVAIEMGLLRPERTERIALLAPALAWLRSRRWRWLLRAPLPLLGLIQPAPRVITEPIVRNLVPGGKDGWSAAGVDEFLRSFLTPRGRVAFYEAARNDLSRRAARRTRLLDSARPDVARDAVHLGAPRPARAGRLQEACRAGTSRGASPGARLRPRAAARGAEGDTPGDPEVLRPNPFLEVWLNRPPVSWRRGMSG